MISGPALALVGPLTPAIITYLLRRWPLLAGLVGALLLLALAAIIGVMPLETSVLPGSTALFAGQTWQALGQTVVLSVGVRAALVGLYVGTAVLCLAAALLPQRPDFIPVMLLTLTPLAAALMLGSSSFGVLLLVVVAGLAVWLAPAGRAALRYLVVFVLAAACLLVVAWMAQSHLVALSSTAWRLFLPAAALLLAGFPVYFWVSLLLEETPALVWAFLLGVVQLGVFLLVASFLLSNQVLARQTFLLNALQASGAATVAAAGLLAWQPWLGGNWSEMRLGQALTHLILVDMGATLMLLGLDPAGSLELLLTQHLARFIALLLAAIGLDGLSRRETSVVTGAARHAPWAAILFLYGGLSLAGLPLTPGFAARWAIIQTLGAQEVGLVILLLLAAISGVALLARVGVELWPAGVSGDDWRASVQIHLITASLYAVAGLIGLGVALIPGPLLSYSRLLAQRWLEAG